MTTGKMKKDRKSVFRELGLDDDCSDTSSLPQTPAISSSTRSPSIDAQEDPIYVDFTESPSEVSTPWPSLGEAKGSLAAGDVVASR